MATLTPQAPGTLTYAAATVGGDTLALGTTTRPVFLVRNGAGSSTTVTLAGINPCNLGFTHNQVVVCAANADTEIVPAAQTIDQTPATRGNVGVTYSSVTTLTVAVVAS